MAGEFASTPATGAPRRWPGVLAVVAALALAYVAVMLIGRAQEAANVRILGVLPFTVRRNIRRRDTPIKCEL